jgi:hypothetical protein
MDMSVVAGTWIRKALLGRRAWFASSARAGRIRSQASTKNHPSRLDGEMGRRARGDFRFRLTVIILGGFISCLSGTVKEFENRILKTGIMTTGIMTIDKLSRRRIIAPNTLKDFDGDEYASYGGQRTGCSWWKSCPHDGAEWTSELQSETITGWYPGERSSASRDTPVSGLGYYSSG